MRVTTTEISKTPSWAGKRVPRREDNRLLRAEGTFVDDEGMHRMGYAQFVRSPYAHARIVSIDTTQADALPGVIVTLTGEEVRQVSKPLLQLIPRSDGAMIEEYLLAVDRVRHQGEAVAVVLAESRDIAADAADLVNVEYQPLPVVIDTVPAANTNAPILHAGLGNNVAWSKAFAWGDIDWALTNADHVVKIDRLHFHRFSSTPLECNAMLVAWDPGTDTIQVVCNNATPLRAGMQIAPSLGVGIDQFHFVTHDIGGSFGIKIGAHRQMGALALLSRKARRPVKWTETRTEHHLSGGHGNERTFLDIEVPVLDDGTILGLKLRALDDVGAYLHSPHAAVIWSQVAPGCYKFRNIHVDYSAILTNKCPAVPNRGYSRMQHLWMIERVVDIVGRELGIDPVEIRKRNYIRPEDYPYETPNGCIYDSGDLPKALDMVLEMINYREARGLQSKSIGTGKRIGIGIGTTLDSGSNNEGQSRILHPDLRFSGNGEVCTAKLDLYGEIKLVLGTTPQGQGHETVVAQVASELLGVDLEQVRVAVGFDTERNAYIAHSGTYASQFAVTGVNAVIGAVQKLRAEILRVASFLLQASEETIELVGGTARVVGNESRAVSFKDIASAVYFDLAALPPELMREVSLNCRYVYVVPFEAPDPVRMYGNLTYTYASQTHAAVIELDEETGKVRILDYAVVDDCGTRINPMIVEGQVHGATAHGIGAALHEELSYGEDGQLLTSNFLFYHAATSVDVPDIKTVGIESPSPFTGTGAKGMGEGGGAPLHALAAAIQDALDLDMPVVWDSYNAPERVLGLLRGRGSGSGRGVQVQSRTGAKED